MKCLLAFALAVFSWQQAVSQRTSFAFWNVENLFDTIPSRFYNDREFTPESEKRWNTERYKTKINNLARAIDELNADVVGLAEVENESVVRDLVSALRTDYVYIHRTSGDPRGIDQAVLYKGDKFFTGTVRLQPSGMRREFLHVEGELRGGTKIDLLVVHMSSKLNSDDARRRNYQTLNKLLRRLGKAGAKIVVMGDMNAAPTEAIVREIIGTLERRDSLYSPHATRQHMRIGSYNYRGRWYLYDWMMVSPELAAKVSRAGIFSRGYLTEPVRSRNGGATSRPRRSFYAGKYRAGYSDHLPVWMEIVE